MCGSGGARGLFHTVQASVCAMIFEFGHGAGRYSALLLELRTAACGLLRMGVADARTAARAAQALASRLGRLLGDCGPRDATLCCVCGMYAP